VKIQNGRRFEKGAVASFFHLARQHAHPNAGQLPLWRASVAKVLDLPMVHRRVSVMRPRSGIGGAGPPGPPRAYGFARGDADAPGNVAAPAPERTGRARPAFKGC